MRQSLLFPKTLKEAPTDAQSVNHKLLVRAGYIDQLMAGSWTLLPLGKRVVGKIEKIIREELTTLGAQEVLMPLLHPKAVWNETGRWESANEVMYKLSGVGKREFVLSFTHEEIFLDLARKHVNSYQDLPLALYHFSTKFRNELRARSGILRGREFLMKDLYSLHTSQKGLDEFYWQVADVYVKIFSRLGLDVRITEAAGGVFTDNKTHEFQVLVDSGEDTVFYCDHCPWSQNKEVFGASEGGTCPECKKGIIRQAKAIELGNIFRFGTSYSEKMNFTYADKDGNKQYPYLGSYGIGVSRILGAWVEINHDDKGIIWGSSLAPFALHLIELPGGQGQKVYDKLLEAGIEVLWDEREVSAGEKFADADLIGIPHRLVTSAKTGDKFEWKQRGSQKTELLTLEDLLKKLA